MANVTQWVTCPQMTSKQRSRSFNSVQHC